MTVTDVNKDAEALTFAITAHFDAPVERIWRLWSEPRQLERWWGPPSHPATFVEHELAPGGSVSYFMTGPEGDKYHGWWRVLETDPPRRLSFEDGFADSDGKPNPELPTTLVTVTLSEDGDQTAMEIQSQFPSREAMDQVLEMGAAEGMQQALSQIDGLLAED